MPKNHSKARKQWRKDRLAYINSLTNISPEERLLLANFGNRSKVLFEPKPGTEEPDRLRSQLMFPDL